VINKFKNTKSYIDNFSDELVKLIKIEIGRNRTRTSKNPRSKITYQTPISAKVDRVNNLLDKTQKLKIESTESQILSKIESLHYADYIDKGISQGKRPPSSEILKWIKNKPVRLRDRLGKFVRLTDAKQKSLAFAISRSIGEFGIRPTNFISNAIDDAIKKLDTLTTPVSQDVMLNVEDILLKSGYIKKGDNFIIKSD